MALSMNTAQTGLINYEITFRYLKRSVQLLNFYEVGAAGTLISAYNLTKGVRLCQKFVDLIVNEVKKTRLRTPNQSCQISTSAITLTQPFELGAVARHLYQAFGIAIVKVDGVISPRTVVVSWLRDHWAFYPVSPLVKIDDQFADTTIEYKEKSYRIHRYILSVRSPKFLELLQTVPSGHAFTFKQFGLETAVFEKFLEYFYEERIDLRTVTAQQGHQLLALANQFELPYLREQWYEELCDRVTVYNFSECLDFAKGKEELNNTLFCEALQKLKTEDLSFLDKLSRLTNVMNLAGLDKLVAAERTGTVKLVDLGKLAVAESRCTEILKPEINNHREKILEFAEQFNFKGLQAACTEHRY